LSKETWVVPVMQTVPRLDAVVAAAGLLEPKLR
jgi:hypothetical protein